MMRYTVLAAAMVLATLGCDRDGGEKEEADETPSAAMAATAAVSADSAERIALALFPGGRVTESKLEQEDGVLIWSLDVQLEGKPGVEEIHVDAQSGAVLKQEHETPDDEAKEEAAEKGKAGK